MTSVDREVERRLRDHNVRYTPHRNALVAALAASDGPRSTAELHDDLGEIPLSTLYRSLSVLEEAGVVEPHFGAKGVTRYELAEWITGHHHHLVCLECGAIEDVEISSGVESRVRELVDGIGERASFAVLAHTLEIEGRCVRCR